MLCVLAHADTCHVSACHCEERSDVAIRSPCSSTKRKAILHGKSVETANLPEVVLSCQVSLRGNGLPHQCAHWFAMTCRRKRRCCVCKNVGRNDMQKAETCLRVQGRFPAVHRQCPGIVRTGGKFLHVIARSGAAAPRRGNPFSLRQYMTVSNFFRRIRIIPSSTPTGGI